MLKKYLLRRLGHGFLLLVLISTFSFILLEFAPGNFLDEAKLNPRIMPETIAALQQRYGLEKPLPLRYAYWLRSLASGDLGVSFAYNMPVSELIWPRALRTLEITSIALIASWMIALPIGIWTAARRSGWMDHAVSATTAGLMSIPDLVLATVVLFIMVRTWSFRSGRPLPAILVLVVVALPPLLRHIRASLISTAGEPFIRAARAQGISGRRLWMDCILPAAAHPLVGLFGLSVAGLLSSSLLIEVILGWPGLGPMFLEAIAARDFYLVVGPVMISAVFLIAGMLVTDLLLYAADPRIRMNS